MPISDPQERRPHRLAKKGVEIISRAPEGGVETHSTHEGTSNPEPQPAEQRVVGKEEFATTKKLEDDEHGA